MCGIFGVVSKSNNQAAEVVLHGLKKLEYRGYDSWGIAVKTISNKLLIEKHIGKISEAKVNLPAGNIALGHTRWATHGGVTDANAHPHLDCSGTIAVIHNGIIENYRELKETLKQKGHRFISDTDTEVIAHLIEEEAKNHPIATAVFRTFNQLKGSNAIGVLDSKSETIISCRDGSPVVVGLGKQENFLASDVTAFLDKTNQALYINDGEGIVISNLGVKLYNLKNFQQKSWQPITIDWNAESAEKGSYPHYTLKEIMEQKTTIIKTVKANQEQIKLLAQKIRLEGKAVFYGCGTAFHCALMGKYFFAQAGFLVDAYGAYELPPFIQFFNKNTILVAISQSGETADVLLAAKAAKLKGAHLVAVVNAIGSTLERMSDTVIKVNAGPEISVVCTKAFTSQLATLYLMAQAAKKDYSCGQADIELLGKELSWWLSDRLQDQVISWARKLLDFNDIYLIGKHINYPAVLECALKIKEASYVHAEAFASGELKHGVISLIQKGIPCIVLASNDKAKAEVLSSAMEMKSRGAVIYGIAPFKAQEFDYYIQTPDLGELTVFANIIVGQLLGYYLGVGRGADPDKPRNLAKSVTVK